MKKEIPFQSAAIRIDEEKTWNDPTARGGSKFHYDLETEFPLSRAQMEALISVVIQFRKDAPCYDMRRFEMGRMMKDE